MQVSRRTRFGRNGKNSSVTRSVWYRGEEDEEHESLPSLKKSTSLGDLLFDKATVKKKITKDMIEAPINPRKIAGFRIMDNYMLDETVNEKHVDNFEQANNAKSSPNGSNSRKKISKDMISGPFSLTQLEGSATMDVPVDSLFTKSESNVLRRSTSHCNLSSVQALGMEEPSCDRKTGTEAVGSNYIGTVHKHEVQKGLEDLESKFSFKNKRPISLRIEIENKSYRFARKSYSLSHLDIIRSQIQKADNRFDSLATLSKATEESVNASFNLESSDTDSASTGVNSEEETYLAVSSPLRKSFSLNNLNTSRSIFPWKFSKQDVPRRKAGGSEITKSVIDEDMEDLHFVEDYLEDEVREPSTLRRLFGVGRRKRVAKNSDDGETVHDKEGSAVILRNKSFSQSKVSNFMLVYLLIMSIVIKRNVSYLMINTPGKNLLVVLLWNGSWNEIILVRTS